MTTLPSALKDFYLNETMRNDVRSYLIDFLKIQAIEKAFNKEGTDHIAEAKEVLDKAFENLDILFSPKSEVKEQPNPSR